MIDYKKVLKLSNEIVIVLLILDKLKGDYELINQNYQKIHAHKLEIHKLSSDYDKFLREEEHCYELL